jgi:hypothetical protein
MGKRTYRILAGNLKGKKKELGRPKNRWEKQY